MSKAAGAPKITSLADLFAVAYQIEADAVERYELLADQMETHNNPELVAVFRDLARAEGIHRDEIRRLAGDIDVVAHARQMAKWNRGESPEEADLGAAHYLMTPWHALQLALAGEKRALAFFTFDRGDDDRTRRSRRWRRSSSRRRPSTSISCIGCCANILRRGTRRYPIRTRPSRRSSRRGGCPRAPSLTFMPI